MLIYHYFSFSIIPKNSITGTIMAIKENNPKREFLKKAGLAVAASALFPTIWVKKSFANNNAAILATIPTATG